MASSKKQAHAPGELYYAITAWEKEEVPNKYPQPLTANGQPNKYAGMATIPVWKWRIIGKPGYNYNTAEYEGRKRILGDAKVISSQQLTGVHALMYANLRVVTKGRLSNYRITLSDEAQKVQE